MDAALVNHYAGWPDRTRALSLRQVRLIPTLLYLSGAKRPLRYRSANSSPPVRCVCGALSAHFILSPLICGCVLCLCVVVCMYACGGCVVLWNSPLCVLYCCPVLSHGVTHSGEWNINTSLAFHGSHLPMVRSDTADAGLSQFSNSSRVYPLIRGL